MTYNLCYSYLYILQSLVAYQTKWEPELILVAKTHSYIHGTLNLPNDAIHIKYHTVKIKLFIVKLFKHTA